MSTDQKQPLSVLFTVRLWREDLGQGRMEWRGQVQHVLSGESRFFRDWAALIAWLQALLADLERSQDPR